MMKIHLLFAQDVIYSMTPKTLVALIADLDEASAQADDTAKAVMSLAMEALLSNVGVDEAIAMLSAADVYAENPVIDEALTEWAKFAPEAV